MSRQLCALHPSVDYKTAWGCPECVAEAREIITELRKQNNKLAAACYLPLMFHSADEWTDEKRNFWIITMNSILGPPSERDQRCATPTNEATTKNLCDAIRAALNQTTNKQTV